MTKVILGLQSHWRIVDTMAAIVQWDLTLAEICSNRRGWHYNQEEYSGGALYI